SKGAKVNRHLSSARLFQRCQRAAKQFRLGVVATELSIRVARRGKSRQPSAVAVDAPGVLSEGDRTHQARILGGQGEDGNAIQRAAGRNNAAGTEQTGSRFQSDKVVATGRNATGTGGVGAQRETH